jgi:hypothetical protein
MVCMNLCQEIKKTKYKYIILKGQLNINLIDFFSFFVIFHL